VVLEETNALEGITRGEVSKIGGSGGISSGQVGRGDRVWETGGERGVLFRPCRLSEGTCVGCGGIGAARVRMHEG